MFSLLFNSHFMNYSFKDHVIRVIIDFLATDYWVNDYFFIDLDTLFFLAIQLSRTLFVSELSIDSR